MSHSVRVGSVIACVGALASAALAQSTVTVNVNGRNPDGIEAAIHDAKRNAVNKAGREHVPRWSELAEKPLFSALLETLVADAIVDIQTARGARPIKKTDQWNVSATVEVDRDKLVKTSQKYAAAVNKLADARIMLFVDDHEDATDFNKDEHAGIAFEKLGSPNDMSYVGTQLERILMENHFTVIRKSRWQFLREQNMTSAKNEQRWKLYELEAKKHGAQFYLEGVGIAYGPRESRETGLDTAGTLYCYTANVVCRVFSSDSAEGLFNTPELKADSCSRHRREAAVSALSEVGEKVGRECVLRFVKTLLRRGTTGGWININVEGADFGKKRAIVKMLESQKGVNRVSTGNTFSGGAAELRVNTTLSVEEIAGFLYDAQFDGFKVDISGYQGTTINAVCKPK